MKNNDDLCKFAKKNKKDIPKQTIDRLRLQILIGRIKLMMEDDSCFSDLFLQSFNKLLDELVEDNVFGTEGQMDPRGDQRNGSFSVWNIEGVDV